MANKYLVHLVNPVSGWVTSIVHTIAADADTAIADALQKFGLPKESLGQTLAAIPQVVGTVAEEEAAQAVAAVVAEPVPASVPAAVSEAENVASKLAADLPPDILEALKKVLG